ncbi:peptide-methionine (R)-S-oxide reductase [Neobacillus sp. NPDC093182]|uniref:peptide-methionine (R)-S-oxide reductase n=1 Tax=Neobacillus sp. NPDC093182 TaxID=3364297 RepID=UPI0037FB5DFB
MNSQQNCKRNNTITGWSTFTKPLDGDYVVLKEESGFLSSRTTARNRNADSYLGDVFILINSTSSIHLQVS